MPWRRLPLVRDGVETAGHGSGRSRRAGAADVVVPSRCCRELRGPYHVHVPGVGGTGVLTLNSVLA